MNDEFRKEAYRILDKDNNVKSNNIKIFSRREYNLYIKTYYWYIRRKKYIDWLSSLKCEICNINEWEEVHHQNYDSLDYDNPWQELDEHLLYLCKKCHNDIHTLATGYHSTKQEDLDKWLCMLCKKFKPLSEEEIELKNKLKIKRKEYKIRTDKKWNKLSAKEKKAKNLNRYNIELRRKKRIARKKLEEEKNLKIKLEKERIFQVEKEKRILEKRKEDEYNNRILVKFVNLLKQSNLVWYLVKLITLWITILFFLIYLSFIL